MADFDPRALRKILTPDEAVCDLPTRYGIPLGLYPACNNHAADKLGRAAPFMCSPPNVDTP